MRDRDTIDAELRLLTAVRQSIREQGGEAVEPAGRRTAPTNVMRVNWFKAGQGFEH